MNSASNWPGPHAVERSWSMRLNHSPIRFQLALVRLTRSKSLMQARLEYRSQAVNRTACAPEHHILMGKSVSLEAQSANRFNPRCAACRNDDGCKRHAGERQGSDQIRQWVAGRDAKDERRSNLAEGDRRGNADDQAREHELCTMPE